MSLFALSYSSFSLSPTVSPVLVGCSALAALAWIWLRYCTTRTRFPPGPPPKFLVGNILDVSPKAAWETLTEYKTIYGDLVFFHGLGNHVLVLNSMQHITNLLEKRPSIYSERPIFTVASELIGLGQSIPMLPYNDELRAQRKLAHLALGPAAVKKYHGIQEDLAALLAKHFLDTPEDFFNHVRHTSSRIILAVTYGLSVKEAENEYIAHAEETMAMIGSVTVPGAFLCDLWPWMKHLPKWFSFHRVAAHGRDMVERFISKPLEHVKEQMRTGNAPQSLAHDLLLMDTDYSPAQEKRIKWTAGCLYGAGGETTYTTVLVFISAMALYPDVQKRAQAELDGIVGLDNLPRMSDRERLPFINAVIKETMRWHPAVPLSIARMTAKQDEYQGFTIPKGTVVIPNVWAVAFTPHGPHDPHEFVPERFLGPDPPIDPIDWAFGFGKRLCPGQNLASNSVFILIATILAAFDVSPLDNQRIVPVYSPGLISYPMPFKCRITPRSKARATQVLWRSESAESFDM